ncbi:MAG TPA: ABC transporter substrate-binding protein [Pseudolabrys sp.]|nr:ABC transporter substrate-binding protein [Pseudolabrys sp.]
MPLVLKRGLGTIVAIWAMIAAATSAQAAPGDSPAERLVVAWQGGATTLDPIMRSETTTFSWQRHIFDLLTMPNREGGVDPRIVTSWKNLDPKTWRLTLRSDVKFHDGSKMTADDVGKSIMDAKQNPKSQVKNFVVNVTGYKVVNPTTIDVSFSAPDPIFPRHLDSIPLMPEALIAKEGREAFEKHPIGSGPYTFESWLAEDHLDIKAWDGFWGKKPDFKYVRLESIPNNATRLAALLSGQVQVAEKVAPADFERVKNSGKTHLTMVPGFRTIYLAMDAWRTTGSAGMPQGQKNPFMDPRVRKAVYQAINVDLIRKKIFNDAVTTATQFIPPHIEGHDKSLKRFPYDIKAAKKLLSEAGYPNGFTVRLDATNDRYFEDSLVAQALGGLLKQVGINVQVNAIPKAVFFPKVNKGDFTMYMAGWGNIDGISTYDALYHCRDLKTGYGHVNREHFCNKKTDAMMAKAAETFDDAARLKLEHQIYDIVDRKDIAYVPLYYENVIAGLSNIVEYKARPDELILAWQMHKAK